MSKRILQEYNDYRKDIPSHYSVEMTDNITEWDFILIGPIESIWEGAILNGKIKFPIEYPNKPPKIIFNQDLFHPNVFKNGEVCISILHEGIDVTGYENPDIRWRPIHGINTVLTSIQSLFVLPTVESPANVDAAKMYINNYNEYKKMIYKIVANSQRT